MKKKWSIFLLVLFVVFTCIFPCTFAAGNLSVVAPISGGHSPADISPITGDVSLPLWVYIVIALVAVAALAFLVILLIKNKKSEK